MTQHPKSAVSINGKWHFLPCDCFECERRYPRAGAGVVLLISGVLAGLAGLLMASCQ